MAVAKSKIKRMKLMHVAEPRRYRLRPGATYKQRVARR